MTGYGKFFDAGGRHAGWLQDGKRYDAAGRLDGYIDPGHAGSYRTFDAAGRLDGTVYPGHAGSYKSSAPEEAKPDPSTREAEASRAQLEAVAHYGRRLSAASPQEP